MINTVEYPKCKGDTVPAGRTGFELIIRVSRKGASIDCRCMPPVTVVLLKADMVIRSSTHWRECMGQYEADKSCASCL